MPVSPTPRMFFAQFRQAQIARRCHSVVTIEIAECAAGSGPDDETFAVMLSRRIRATGTGGVRWLQRLRSTSCSARGYSLTQNHHHRFGSTCGAMGTARWPVLTSCELKSVSVLLGDGSVTAALTQFNGVTETTFESTGLVCKMKATLPDARMTHLNVISSASRSHHRALAGYGLCDAIGRSPADREAYPYPAIAGARANKECRPHAHGRTF